MLIRYLKGKYIGENRNVTQIFQDVSSYIDKNDAAHIKQIMAPGCTSKISFNETSARKASIVCKGNQATLKMHPEIATNMMNQEERHSTCFELEFGYFITLLGVVTQPRAC
jgi:hypothetical protein